LWPLLHQRMQEIAGPSWRVGRWVAMANDG
jgi:hypothetical protein